MSTSAGRSPEIRASDAERESIARTLQAAAGDGRLTLDEVDQRLSLLYEAKFRSELAVLVEDLPAKPEPAQPAQSAQSAQPAHSTNVTGRRVHPALVMHAVVVAVFGVLLIGRWVGSDSPFFWPMFPMFWMGISLLVHARIRSGFGRISNGRPSHGPPWRARMSG